MRHPLFREAEDGRSIATEDGFVVNSPRYDAPADSRNPNRPHAGIARRKPARLVASQRSEDGRKGRCFTAHIGIRFAVSAIFVRRGKTISDVSLLRLALRNYFR